MPVVGKFLSSGHEKEMKLIEIDLIPPSPRWPILNQDPLRTICRLLLLLALERHKAKVIKSTVSGLESPRSSQSTKPGKEEGKADSRLRAAAPVTITVREKLIFFIYTISCIQLNVRIASHLICRFKRNFSMNTTLKKIFYWLKSHSLIPNSLSKRIFMVNSCSSLLQEIN